MTLSRMRARLDAVSHALAAAKAAAKAEAVAETMVRWPSGTDTPASFHERGTAAAYASVSAKMAADAAERAIKAFGRDAILTAERDAKMAADAAQTQCGKVCRK